MEAPLLAVGARLAANMPESSAAALVSARTASSWWGRKCWLPSAGATPFASKSTKLLPIRDSKRKSPIWHIKPKVTTATNRATGR